MHKTMMEVESICEIRKKLECILRNEVEEGRENLLCHFTEIGYLTDMVKDLSEAEAEKLKAKYYEMMICEMMMQDESMHDAGKMGYDHWRYADVSVPRAQIGSNRASKMHGDSIREPYDQMRRMERDDQRVMRDISKMEHDGRMGYPMSKYDMYKQHKEKYKSTGVPFNETERHEMDAVIEDATYDSIDSLKEMWADANPETRKKLIGSVAVFLEEMKKSK